MRTWMKAALGVVVWAACAASAMAQTLTVPKAPVIGQGITIGYSDPGRAGETITIEIDNGYPIPIVIELQVTLDENGNGSIEWMVPAWMGGNFNAPGVHEESRDFDLGVVPIFAARRGTAAQATTL